MNNAGFGHLQAFAETDQDVLLAMIGVNVTALTHLTRLVLPGMIERGSGRIMNVASTAAFQPGPLMAVYYASKAYVLSFSEGLRAELQGSGVTVTALCPGPTETGFGVRARVTGSRLFDARIMEAADVASKGFRAMMAGDGVVVPGAANALAATALRHAPRGITNRVVRRLHERA